MGTNRKLYFTDSRNIGYRIPDTGYRMLCTLLSSNDQKAIPIRLIPHSVLSLGDTAIATDYYQLCVDPS
jgi:hypothetical protein